MCYNYVRKKLEIPPQWSLFHLQLAELMYFVRSQIFEFYNPSVTFKPPKLSPLLTPLPQEIMICKQH